VRVTVRSERVVALDPAGDQHVVLDDASSGLAFTAAFLTGQGVRTGQEFAGDWHVAFGATTTTTTTTSTTTTTLGSPSGAFLE
jgi:hypothetical protein